MATGRKGPAVDGKALLKYGIGLALLGWVIFANWDDRFDPLAASKNLVESQQAILNGDPLPEPYTATPGLRAVLQRPIQWLPLVTAAIVCALATLLTFVRWYLLVRAQDLPFSLRNAMRLGLVGYYFNTFLPGSVGGDLLKAVAISREQTRRTVAVATVMIDRAIGLWGLLWFVGGLGAIFWWLGDPMFANVQIQSLVRRALWLLGISVVGWILLGFLPQRRADRFAGRLLSIPKLGNSLAELWRAVWMYRQKPKAVAVALVLSMVGHIGFVLTFHLAARVFATGDPNQAAGTLAEHFLIVPVGMIVLALFPTPGGVGGGEAAYAWLYTSMLGRAGVIGVLGCLAQRLITLGLGLIGYIVYLRMKTVDPQAMATPSSEVPVDAPADTPNGASAGATDSEPSAPQQVRADSV
ncbi:lysylphosphatidylglycerol synthase transmembrane domain-containing protein [Tuwongella immobilis]|uniref:Flippase-like domain-containing protein n=1 Tax=Tuwongella immobilis TaxID=692036 RepID=A0A6C2YJP1_9BACT|nr:lysylphosphatidylglycerol synthase transmembrane domain-containing protein [Tuwongella immobilis]VIP01501.1 Uncharacterized protein OS=Planctomyces limnophilus (strain ATCC 43296 / DSM 3776 / IFAM 1008 / 290) GN=Plim_1029 PE=4 SV=1: UPF0104 [Tuwongella immobilis]VTR98595.1 Uncharacterized protein OS=Planctomyces limnophilus (strain ATCC 43296 / DSM 3776 / IFAM 1008 / 290) GN=Plim_1029 PE=4 SV=1: UPF0104 [Tuwongella immobilis]